METKEKIAKLNDAIAYLGLTPKEAIELLELTQEGNRVTSSPKVKPGMFWFEDDTFSVDRIEGKKIKAIVELVRYSVIYGDLTASELFDIEEKYLNYYDAKDYLENFSYPCKNGEKIVSYDLYQIQDLAIANCCVETETSCFCYPYVRDAFNKINKKYRYGKNWSFYDRDEDWRTAIEFNDGNNIISYSKVNDACFVRPVLALPFHALKV